MTAAVIVAAGRGERMGGAENKLRITVRGKSVAAHTIDRFFGHPEVDCVAVVRAPRDAAFFDELNRARYGGSLLFADGGDTRSASVKSGLARLPKTCDAVLIHDGARPFVSANVISRCIASALAYGSGIAAIPVTDTVGNLSAGRLSGQIDRDKLALIQTPQAFRYKDICRAYDDLPPGAAPTDDSAVYLVSVGEPRLVAGSRENVKITYPDDLLRFGSPRTEPRVGTGADAHRLVPDRKLILGGVDVPFEAGLDGHSDADVLTHAVMDSLLSAAALPDIGALFPDSDPTLAGVSSLLLLERVREKLAAKNCRVLNVSAVLIAERPKLMTYLSSMEVHLARALQIPADRVKVSATTTEGMGFTGRREGIAATATSLIERPEEEDSECLRP